MPNVSISARPSDGFNQPQYGSAAPTTAGTVEVRIGNGLGHDQALAALETIRARMISDRAQGA